MNFENENCDIIPLMNFGRFIQDIGREGDRNQKKYFEYKRRNTRKSH